MDSTQETCVKHGDKKVARRVQKVPQNEFSPEVFTWRLSCIFSESCLHDIIFKRTSSYLFRYYREDFRNVCPADIKVLGQQTSSCYYKRVSRDRKSEDFEVEDTLVEEYESKLDIYPNCLSIKPSKRKTWEEYKRLIRLAKSLAKPESDVKQLLTHITSLPKIYIGRRRAKSRPILGTFAKRSIIKTEMQRTILISSTTDVKFHNFQLNKLYKKIVTLQNVSNSPAKFQLEGRPSCSKFLIMIKSGNTDRNIIPPGMKVQLIVFFRCDNMDEPEEVLIVNVEYGRSIIIRLRGYKDPPILRGVDTSQVQHLSFSGKRLSSIDTWYPQKKADIKSESTEITNSTATDSSNSNNKPFMSLIFDCKKCFVGEKVHVCLRYKNFGGVGRFFVMSEIDWCSMHIEDIINTNMLILPVFVLWPVFFSLKPQEEISLHTYFSPDSFGIHVDKLYIVCDNCSVVQMEIIGDGIMYEPDFIQLSKLLMKVWPCDHDIDKRARYYVNLGTGVSNEILRSIISVTNTRTLCAGTRKIFVTVQYSQYSEMALHFVWRKRDVESESNKVDEMNYFPLEFLDIYPHNGIFSPSTIHHFSISATLNDLRPNRYYSVLQLYVEDIPLAAIAKKTNVHTEECTTKRRLCSRSVNVWIADIEIWFQVSDPVSESDSLEGELINSCTDVSDEIDYFTQCYNDNMDCQKRLQLAMDELFSHWDVINIQQVGPYLYDDTCLGIIRPPRPLFVGVEETYNLIVKNVSDHAIIYSWDVPTGADEDKMKLRFCPNKGKISGRAVEIVKIILLPIKEGHVSSLYTPCYIEDLRKIMMLGIECSIEPLYVTFYVPTQHNDRFQVHNDFLRIEWRANSLMAALDTVRKPYGNEEVLNEYKMREERELMNTDLDQGDVLKDSSAGPSADGLHGQISGGECTSTASTSEIIQMVNSGKQNGQRSSENIPSSSHVVPFHKTVLPIPTQTVVIEFLNVPLRTVKKKTFVIKNETAIQTRFQLSIKNFYPPRCSCKSKSKQEYIQSIYKKVFGRDSRLVEETLIRMKQPGSGILIYVNPLKGVLGSFGVVSIDIYVFADTWGIYVDELNINICGLPEYTLGICVHVVGSPIALPICEGTSRKVPILSYGTIRLGTRFGIRKVFLKNTSILPVAINWHTVLMKPTESTKTLPFSVLLDAFTPFTNDLAASLRIKKTKTHPEKLFATKLDKYTPEDSIRSLDKFYPISVTDSDIQGPDTCSDTMMGTSVYSLSVAATTPTSSSYWDSSINSKTSENYCSKESPKKWKECGEIVKDSKAWESGDRNEFNETRDTEFKISILPYYGLIDKRACVVAPREIFIPPGERASVNIGIHPETCHNVENAEFLCKVLGFVRIAPIDKYQDNCYSRLDGVFLPPIEIDVNARIVKPQLNFDISKSDRTFTCCANDVTQSRKRTICMKKTFFFHNCENGTIYVSFEAHFPFSVHSISIYAETIPCKPLESICINANGCAEVEVHCIVNLELIETMINAEKCQDLHNSIVSLKESLSIMHSDRSHQDVDLILQVILPSLSLSSYTLNYESVYIGDTKKLILIIKNMSACTQNFTIKKKYNNDDYTIDRKEKELVDYRLCGKCSTTIIIAFTPNKPGQSAECLEIVTCIPNITEECVLIGEGTLDKKYHLLGI